METVKVKMLTSMAGQGFVRNVGDEIEVSAAEAARLVKKGFAKLAAEPVTLTQSKVKKVTEPSV